MPAETRFRIKSSRLIHENFENEVVIVDLDTGSYYSLNGGGADLWSLIERRAPVGEMVAALGLRYEAEPTEIENAVGLFLAELQQEHLIEPDVDTAPSFAEDIVSPPIRSEASRSVWDAPRVTKYTDMQELLLLDPIHDVDDTGWPHSMNEAAGVAV